VKTFAFNFFWFCFGLFWLAKAWRTMKPLSFKRKLTRSPFPAIFKKLR
jgi:hypothetical protein